MRDEKILKNLGLIYKVIKDLHCKYNNYRDDETFDEIYTTGLIGLIRGVDTFKPGIVKENTYYYKCIRNEILHLFTIRTSPKRYTNVKPVSLDKEIIGSLQLQDIIPDDINLEEDLIFKDTLERVLDTLNKTEKKLNVEIFCKNYGIGCKRKTIRELALEYDISYSAISARVQGVLKRLRKELLK